VPISSPWAGPSSTSTSSAPAEATFRTYYTPPRADPLEGGNGTVFVCVHGAGYSALSFAELARALAGAEEAEAARGKGKSKRGRVGVLAYDARGHGALLFLHSHDVQDDMLTLHERMHAGRTSLPAPLTSTSTSTSPTVDMSLEHLSADLAALLKTLFPDRTAAPALVLVGHSMVRRLSPLPLSTARIKPDLLSSSCSQGGAVVADACNRIQTEVADVTGVAVIDVVEGALAPLFPRAPEAAA